MLTKLETKCLFFLFTCSTKVPSIPVAWNGRYFIQKKIKCYNVIPMILFCINTIWACWYFWEFSKSIQKRHYFGITLNFIHTIGQIISITYRLVLWKFTQDFLTLINQLLYFNSKQGKTKFVCLMQAFPCK